MLVKASLTLVTISEALKTFKVDKVLEILVNELVAPPPITEMISPLEVGKQVVT